MADTEGSVDTGNPEGSESNWTEGLDDYREVIDAKGWQSNADVMKSYVNLEKAVGADKVVLPAEESDILEWDGWERLGTPKEAADYAMAAPEGFEQYDTTLSDDMRSVFHDAKLTPAQAQLIHDRFVDRMMSTQTEMTTGAQQQNESWEGELKKEFGAAFDDRIAAARNAMREFGTPELQGAIDAAGLGSHPDLVRAFAKAGMMLGTGSQFKDGESSGNFGITPDAAKEQIAALRNNPGLMDAGHPEHKVLNEKLTKLTELAYGTDVVVTGG